MIGTDAPGRDRKPRRTAVLGAVLTIVLVPVVMVPVQAARFYAYNRDNRSLVSSAIERTYLLHVPTNYDATKPTPLVISLHGAGLWGVAQKDMSRWNEVADAAGFIVAYPSGIGGHGPRAWRVEANNPRGRDNIFIAQLIDTLRARYNIDSDRIYVNGLSNGGGMSFGLSCALSRSIAAVGLVASAQTEAWRSCTDTSAVPMINFHGTDDRFAAYKGGTSWVLPHSRAFPSQLVWTARWAKRNGCKAGPSDSAISATVTRRTYSQCTHGADVVLYTIEHGGHTWPGGGAQPTWFVGVTDRSIDATSVIWQFFLDHPLHH